MMSQFRVKLKNIKCNRYWTGLKLQKTTTTRTSALDTATWKDVFLAEGWENPSIRIFFFLPANQQMNQPLHEASVIWSTFLSVQLGANWIAQQRCSSLLPFPDSARLFPCYPKTRSTHSIPRGIEKALIPTSSGKYIWWVFFYYYSYFC